MGLQKLLIIGAGPKAMAIASKNKVLRELGFQVPEIHIIEKNEVGANWTGSSGYTNGQLELGTSPEKDVGFPYQSSCWDADTNRRIDQRMKDFSWQNFLISEHRFSSWVDRGRPAPLHKEWAAYLQWVSEQLSDEVTYHRGEVNRLQINGSQWILQFIEPNGQTRSLNGDGLVVTGPGRVKMAKALPNHDNLMTVESFWSRYSNISARKDQRVAIVGTGETAAAIAMSLVESTGTELGIDILSPTGMTFSRGESFRENRVYSNADAWNWHELTVEDRQQFIKRTDRGVFSQYAQKYLDRSDNINVIPGRLNEVSITSNGALNMHYEYNSSLKTSEYDYIIVATGADQLSFLHRMMDEESLQQIEESIGEFKQECVENRIARDLSIEGLTPKLHLPMLSGVMQGPGFANLSCLGRLSDRVLCDYLAEEASLKGAI